MTKQTNPGPVSQNARELEPETTSTTGNPFHSPKLGTLLTRLATEEQTQRDLKREEELAKLRAVQQFD